MTEREPQPLQMRSLDPFVPERLASAGVFGSDAGANDACGDHGSELWCGWPALLVRSVSLLRSVGC